MLFEQQLIFVIQVWCRQMLEQHMCLYVFTALQRYIEQLIKR